MTQLAYMIEMQIDLDTDRVEIIDIEPRFTTDSCGYGVEDFHRGMTDLEYDSAVPSNFGREDDENLLE